MQKICGIIFLLGALATTSPLFAQETDVMGEFSSICLGSLQSLDSVILSAKYSDYSEVPNGIASEFSLIDASEQSDFLKSTPFGSGTLILNIGRASVDTNPVIVCSISGPHRFDAMENAAVEFFRTPPASSFISDGNRVSTWKTYVNGAIASVLLVERFSGAFQILVTANETQFE